MKSVHFAVAAVVRRPGEPGTFLAVRRPLDDDHLPGVWGLPAVRVAAGELPEAALRRLGREKLGATLEPVSFVGIQTLDRGEYQLILMDLEARLVGGEPAVATAPTTATRYVDQQWTADLALLADAARRGSLCSRILLDSAGISY